MSDDLYGCLLLMFGALAFVVLSGSLPPGTRRHWHWTAEVPTARVVQPDEAVVALKASRLDVVISVMTEPIRS